MSPLFVLPTLRRSWSGNQTNRESTSCDKHSWACYVYRAAGEEGEQGSWQKHWTLLKDGPWPLRMHQTFHTPRGAKVVLERKWNQRLTIAVTGNSKHKLPKKYHFHVSSESCRTVQNN